jgi:hypothetical protein
MNINLKFTISSHKNFYDKTLNVLVPSLLDSGIPNNDIYFFVGGYDVYESIPNEYNINLYKASHNSIDFTGLISVIDLTIKADYWFLCHDTCRVGSKFYDSIKNNNFNTDTIRLTSENRSMNIGAYKQSYIYSIKEKILSYRGSSSIEYNIQKLKKRLIDEEDSLLKSDSIGNFNKSQRKVIDSNNLYDSNVRRITEYFPDIDFFKMKSNWKPKEEYELNI